MKHLPIPQIMIFLASLLLGRFGGAQYAAEATASLHRAARQSLHPAVYEMLPEDQTNFLVIKVDALSAEQPQLEHLWWMLHKRQGAINLVSIFPSLGADRQMDSVLQSQFAILKDPEGYQLAPAFEQHLRSLNLTWQGYLILDEEAFRQLLGNQPQISDRIFAPLPYPQLEHQLIEWRLFCHENLQASWQEPTQNTWIRAMDQQHLSFGSLTSQGLQIWHQLMSDTPINTCTFPVLDNKFDY